MTLYILVKAEVSMQGVEPDIDLVYGGSKADCKLKMKEIVEEELLDFDLDDPDTWIIEDTGDGNDGECYTIYRILPVEIDNDENLARKLKQDNEKIRSDNVKLVAELAQWKERYSKLTDAIRFIKTLDTE